MCYVVCVIEESTLAFFFFLDEKLMAFDGTNKKTESRIEVCWQSIFVILFKPCISNERVEFFVVYTGDMVALA